MNLSIRGRHVRLTDELQDHVERRVEFALRRVEHRVKELVVHLQDVNGSARGGRDKHCRITATLSGAETVMVEAVDAGVRGAIDHAMERLKRAVMRELKRRSKRDGTGAMKSVADAVG